MWGVGVNLGEKEMVGLTEMILVLRGGGYNGCIKGREGTDTEHRMKVNGEDNRRS